MTTTNRISPLVLADNAALDTARMTLVDQLVHWASLRIEERVFLPGMRMPSIRALAEDKRVSRFSVVEAYERLVAQGYLEARRGSGFYVRERPVITLEAALERVARLLGVAREWLDLSTFLPDFAPDADPRLRRSAVASSFAAALELAKQGRAEIAQDETFGPIRLKAAS